MAKYTQEQTARIQDFIDSYNGGEIPYSDFEGLIDEFNDEFSTKSLGAKIRFMKGKVAPRPVQEKQKVFSPEDEQVIRDMTADPDNMPWLEEIADRLGKDANKVRGKLVSMRVKGVKKRDLVEKPKSLFSDEDVARILERTSDPNNMPFIEDLAEELNIAVNSLKGKIASLRIKGVLSKKAKGPRTKIYTDELKEELKELIKSHTVEQIAEMKNLNFVGLRSILGKMGLVEKKTKQVYWTDERVAELKDYIAQGKEFKEIGDLMNKNPLVIAKKVKQLQATEEAA